MQLVNAEEEVFLLRTFPHTAQCTQPDLQAMLDEFWRISSTILIIKFITLNQEKMGKSRLKKKWKLANDKELSDFMYYMLCAMPVGLVSGPSVKILYSNRCFTVLQLLNFISRHNCQIYHQTSLACLNTLHSATICSNLQHA